MQLIAAAEGKRRGSYGGAVGYFTAHGDLDTCIVIRSAYVQDGIATVQAGAGIVLDSVPSLKRMKPVIKLARCCAPLPRPTTRRRFSDG
jgi:anthranilate/para-aminobenzoate synthase component I